jgi:hypothetical protein
VNRSAPSRGRWPKAQAGLANPEKSLTATIRSPDAGDLHISSLSKRKKSLPFSFCRIAKQEAPHRSRADRPNCGLRCASISFVSCKIGGFCYISNSCS